MQVYIVKDFNGEPNPSHEVEEIAWVTTKDIGTMQIGSIFAHEVMPRLAAAGLID